MEKYYLCYNEGFVAKERKKQKLRWVNKCIGQNSEYVHSCTKGGKKLFKPCFLVAVSKEGD